MRLGASTQGGDQRVCRGPGLERRAARARTRSVPQEAAAWAGEDVTVLSCRARSEAQTGWRAGLQGGQQPGPCQPALPGP